MQARTILGVVVGGILALTALGDSRGESSSSAIPSLEIVSINPASPAILKAGEKVIVKVRFDMGDCESVQIWVRSSSSSRGEISHPCSPIPRSYGRTGYTEGWLYFDDKAQVKEIKVMMKDVAKKAFVYETTKTVDFQWTAAPAPKNPNKFEGTTRIPGSYTWDIDSDTIGGNSKLVDLWWQASGSKERSLIAQNNAGMEVMVQPYDQVTLDQLRKKTFQQKAIGLSGQTAFFKPGLCLGLKTSEGRIAKLELLADEFPRSLVFRWYLYPEIANQESEPQKPIQTNSSKQYAGLWVYDDPWGRSNDRIVALEGRFEPQGKLAFDLVKHSCVSKPAFTEAAIRKDQIEIRFGGIEYAGQNSGDKTMSYSLLYHEGQLLGQVFRDGLEPEKVVLRRPDIAMTGQIVTILARDYRQMQSRREREQTQAASEKLAFRNAVKLLEADNLRLQTDKSGLAESLNRARQEIEDMKASWDRAKEQIAGLQKEMSEVRQANRELSEQKEKVLKTVQSLEDMLRQARVTKQD